MKDGDLRAIWKRAEVWFRPHIPVQSPWGDESLLKEVPAEAEGHYGIELSATAQIDSEVYEEGQVAIVDSEQEWAQLLGSTDKIRSVLVPWFSRLIPVSLLVPHTETIDLDTYRKRIQPHLLKSLAITLGLGALGFLYPEFLMLALLGAMFYGLFPLVSSAAAWCRRVDRLSVSDLNDEFVRDEFFLRWVASKGVRGLIIGVVILVILFLGQLSVGLGESYEVAALVRSKVKKTGSGGASSPPA